MALSLGEYEQHFCLPTDSCYLECSFLTFGYTPYTLASYLKPKDVVVVCQLPPCQAVRCRPAATRKTEASFLSHVFFSGCERDHQ